MRYITLFALILFSIQLSAQELDYSPKILMVTAHPDDDVIFSATVWKTTKLLGGTVDLAVMTNGEGGYKYSTLGNFVYGLELDKEEVGREYLPGIRKMELMNGGKIVGIRNYFFTRHCFRKIIKIHLWDGFGLTRGLNSDSPSRAV